MGKTGNVVPTITKAEHVGPDDTGDNVEAKRVVGYKYDLGSSSWQRDGVGSSDFRFDPNDDTPTYIGKNLTLNAATSDATWTIFKFTYSGANVTRIQKTTGVWDNRASLF